jgi:hypothetical protein
MPPTPTEKPSAMSPVKCSTKLATMRARILIGCYRKSEANDPEIWLTAVVSVLTRYTTDVAIAVTEPATGLPAKSKWLPSVAEIVEACDAHNPSYGFITHRPPELADYRREPRPSDDYLDAQFARLGLMHLRKKAAAEVASKVEFTLPDDPPFE